MSDHGLDALYQADIYSFQVFRVASDVVRQEVEELVEHGIIDLGRLGASQDYLAILADCVVDLVPLAQLEGATNGLGHSGLVPVSKRGLDFKRGSHVDLQCGRMH
ncbi:hypothetical protein D3C85_1574500 [compost metagenome]